jgi:hypothetical protein
MDREVHELLRFVCSVPSGHQDVGHCGGSLCTLLAASADVQRFARYFPRNQRASISLQLYLWFV